ncbi:MAG: 30S ribosomal protein S16 [Fimbriimonadaceae bacterium]
MVKIRLRRMGNRHRPFYRIVVARSTSARDGSFIEQIGTYNPVTQPKVIELKGERALHWLLEGAQPTETVAVLMKKQGVLDEFFEKRPKAKASYKFLDKRTSAMSRKSVVTEVPTQPKAEEAPVAAAETPEAVAPVDEAPIEATATEAVTEEATGTEGAHVAEEAPAEEATPAEEAPAEGTEEQS